MADPWDDEAQTATLERSRQLPSGDYQTAAGRLAVAAPDEKPQVTELGPSAPHHGLLRIWTDARGNTQSSNQADPWELASAEEDYHQAIEHHENLVPHLQRLQGLGALGPAPQLSAHPFEASPAPTAGLEADGRVLPPHAYTLADPNDPDFIRGSAEEFRRTNPGQPLPEQFMGTPAELAESKRQGYIDSLRSRIGPPAKMMTDTEVLGADARVQETTARNAIASAVRHLLTQNGGADTTNENALAIAQRNPHLVGQAIASAMLPQMMQQVQERETRRRLLGGALADDTPERIVQDNTVADAYRQQLGQRAVDWWESAGLPAAFLGQFGNAVTLGLAARAYDVARGIAHPELDNKAAGMADVLSAYSRKYPWTSALGNLAGMAALMGEGAMGRAAASAEGGAPALLARLNPLGRVSGAVAGAVERLLGPELGRTMAGRAAAGAAGGAAEMPLFSAALAATGGQSLQETISHLNPGHRAFWADVVAGVGFGGAAAATPHVIARLTGYADYLRLSAEGRDFIQIMREHEAGEPLVAAVTRAMRFNDIYRDTGSMAEAIKGSGVSLQDLAMTVRAHTHLREELGPDLAGPEKNMKPVDAAVRNPSAVAVDHSLARSAPPDPPIADALQRAEAAAAAERASMNRFSTATLGELEKTHPWLFGLAEARALRQATGASGAAPTPAGPHPDTLANADAVGDWYARTFGDSDGAPMIRYLASTTPGPYVLAEMPIGFLNPNRLVQGETNPANVERYAKMGPASQPPLLAVRGGDGELLIADGRHRYEAAEQRGDKTITAYVPQSSLADVVAHGGRRVTMAGHEQFQPGVSTAALSGAGPQATAGRAQAPATTGAGPAAVTPVGGAAHRPMGAGGAPSMVPNPAIPGAAPERGGATGVGPAGGIEQRGQLVRGAGEPGRQPLPGAAAVAGNLPAPAPPGGAGAGLEPAGAPAGHPGVPQPTEPGGGPRVSAAPAEGQRGNRRTAGAGAAKAAEAAAHLTRVDPATRLPQDVVVDLLDEFPRAGEHVWSGDVLSVRTAAGRLIDPKLDEGTQERVIGHMAVLDALREFVRATRAEPSAAPTRGPVLTKADIANRLLEAYESTRLGLEDREERELDEAGAGMADAFTFVGKLPGEVLRHIENNPAARRLFRVTDDAALAHGEDVMQAMGDRYWQLVDRVANGSAGRLRDALNEARASQDPELRFLASVYDTKVREGARKQTVIPAGALREGQEATINDIPVRVVRDQAGELALDDAGDLPQTPLAALGSVPLDRGSLRGAAAATDLPLARLNDVYDWFVRHYGPLHSVENAASFAEDPLSPALLSIERWDPAAQKAEKGDVFQAAGAGAVAAEDLAVHGPSAIESDMFGRPYIATAGLGEQVPMFHEPNAAEPVVPTGPEAAMAKRYRPEETPEFPALKEPRARAPGPEESAAADLEYRLRRAEVAYDRKPSESNAAAVQRLRQRLDEARGVIEGELGPEAAYSIPAEGAAEPEERPPVPPVGRPTAGRIGGAGAEPKAVLRPMPMVEMLRLARELLGGGVPVVRRLRRALGGFVPKGEGKIVLDARQFKDPREAAATLAHEIGHLEDWLPDRPKNIARGNVLGRIGKLNYWMRRTAPGVLGNNPEIRRELIGLSEWWRPYDKTKVKPNYVRYRNSAKELYAEALSVLLNAPGEVEARAPKFYRSLMDAFDRHEPFRREYLELQDVLAGTPENIARLRRNDIRESFAKGEEIWKARNLERYQSRFSVIDDVMQLFLDRAQPMLKLQREVERKGEPLPEALNAKLALEELAYTDNTNHLFLAEHQRTVYRPLLEAGLTKEDMGEYLALRRMVNERTEIANPWGYTPQEASKQLDDLQRWLGPEKWSALERLATVFHDQVYAAAERAVELGSYNRQTFDTVIAPNRGNYATFAVLDHLEASVPAGIREQIGTFKDIANPYTATLMKTLSLNRLNDLQQAKNTVRDFLTQYFPGDIEKARVPVLATTSAGRVVTGRPRPPGPGRDHLVVLEDGMPAYYAVDRYIARVFATPNVNLLGRVSRLIESATYKLFHRLYVEWNPAWALANVPRDFQRFYRNAAVVPGATVGKIIGAYFRSLGPAWRRAKGIDDATIDRMVAAKALQIPGREFADDPDNEQYRRLLARYGLGPDQARGVVSNLLHNLVKGAEAVGSYTISLPKIAGWNLAKEAGWSDAQSAWFVRNLAGHPNRKRRGLMTSLSNGLFMYSNVMAQALRSDLHAAVNPGTKAGWWLRGILTGILPKLLLRGATAGAFGYLVKKMVDAMSEYDKANYDCLPFGWDSSGKAHYLRMPKDEFSRLLGGLFWKSTAPKGPAAAGADDVNFLWSQTPNVSPALESANYWSQYLRGMNPYDSFYRREIETPDDFRAGGWYAAKDMLRWQVDQFGVASIVFHALAEKTLGGYAGERSSERYIGLQSVPGLNRFIKVSDQGTREGEWDALREQDEERARFRLSLPHAALDLVRQRYTLDRLAKTGPLSADDQRQAGRLKAFYSQVYLPLTKGILAAQQKGDTKLENQLRQNLSNLADQFSERKP